jgi:hypothetical protein
MTREHKHKAVKTSQTLRSWNGCVSPDTCKGARAHGNVIYVDLCRCGATRRTEVNQTHETRGAWVSE